MSEQFFNADKANRNAAFHFEQGDGQGAIDGDQSAYVHPFPASLATGQKVGNPMNEPAPPLSGAATVGREPSGSAYNNG